MRKVSLGEDVKTYRVNRGGDQPKRSKEHVVSRKSLGSGVMQIECELQPPALSRMD